MINSYMRTTGAAAVLTLGLAVALAFATLAWAELFVYTDENGSILLTDKPYLKNEEYTRDRTWASSPIHEYQSLIQEAAERYIVDPTLVSAIIKAESNYDELAISRRGAMGLMQLMPDIAPQLGVQNPFDPKENIDGGVKLLRYLLERFSGNVELAVAAYNCGATNVERFGSKIPPYPETRRYVQRVFENYHGKRIISIPSEHRNTVTKVVHDDGTVRFAYAAPKTRPRPGKTR